MQRAEARKRLKEAAWLETARPFFACLDGENGRTRAVGGIVRDTLLGVARMTTDIDLATELLPEAVGARAAAAGLSVHPTGIDHGTVTLVHKGVTAEVTTLRADLETFGRRATVRFGKDWAEDARRRDFTMNALYAHMDGTLFDPLKGLSDCLAGKVRFIGDPDKRIEEDRLRVYRFFRFSVSHGGQRLDPEGLSACGRAAGALDVLSAERVGAEMMKLLAQARCAAVIRAMAEARVLPDAVFTPGVLVALEALERAPVTLSAPARLAVALIVNRRKPPLQEQWRLSNADMGAILDCAGAALLAGELAWSDLAYRFPRNKRLGVAIIWAVLGETREWLEEGLAAVDGLTPPAFPLSGRDLAQVGLLPGPWMGAELGRLEALWIESGFALDRETLLGMVRSGQ